MYVAHVPRRRACKVLSNVHDKITAADTSYTQITNRSSGCYKCQWFSWFYSCESPTHCQVQKSKKMTGFELQTHVGVGDRSVRVGYVSKFLMINHCAIPSLE